MSAIVINNLRRLSLKTRPLVAMYSNDGAIREAGGSFAVKEKAQEDQYFRKLQAEQLHKIKEHTHSEIEAHEKEIKRHQEQIERLKKNAAELEKK